MFSDHKLATMEEYLRKLSGQEREPLGVTCDHNYVKPWHAHTDSHRTKPAKLLFMNAVHKPKSTYIYPDEEIDVVDVPVEDPFPASIFDSQKTRVLANELERSLRCNLNTDADNSELENFPVENYSFQKRKMYREIMELINAEILAKVVYNGQPHEFIKRKITTERCARELRNIFANTFYDFDTILWIHGLILDKGNLLSISSYLNILQALGSKIPSFVDKILKSYSGTLGYEYLCQILKKQWDPILPVLNKNKPRKLPGNPFLIMNCAGFNLSKATDKSSRFSFWTTHLNTLCKTLYIPMDYDNKNTYEEVLDDAILTLTKKISESKNHFPKRPVILAGWSIGALIACHVALETAVDAVVCFGFPFTGVNGSRGDLNDPLLDSNVPTLFIIGQNSNMCSTDDIENFRSHMRVESGLIVVGGADDFLRISPQKMLLEGITQEIVDRCILEEISEFLHSAVVKMPISERGFIPKRHADIDVIHHKERYRQKRKHHHQYSSDKSSRKHMKVSEEATDFSVKSNYNILIKKSQQDILKKVKTSPVEVEEKRSPIKKLRIKIPKPPVQEFVVKPKIPKEKVELSKLAYNTYYSEDPVAILSNRKSEISFALNILPKKDETVDVAAAFGNDCSFLPRPFSPELNDPVLTEEQKVESNSTEPSFISSENLESNCVNVSNLDPGIICTDMDSSMSSAVVPSNSILDSTSVSGSIVNPTSNVASDSKKGVSVFTVPPSFTTEVIKDKALPSKPVASLNICSETVSSSSQVPSSSSTKSIITVPSSAATLLVSGQTYKISSGKFLQLLSKGSVSIKSKNTVMPAFGKSGESTSQLLSTNVIASEHQANVPKKTETSSVATYVKLASPNMPQNTKSLLDLKPSQTSTVPVRMETPAELAEKRLAIQALNNSLHEPVTLINKAKEEPSYSICYTKPDGSIITRKIIRPPIRTNVRPHTSLL